MDNKIDKMDMFNVPAADFIDYCIRQNHQNGIQTIKYTNSIEPYLLDEDSENKRSYHPEDWADNDIRHEYTTLNDGDQDDNTALYSIDFFQSSISSYDDNGYDTDTDMDTDTLSDENSWTTNYERNFNASQTDFEEDMSTQSNVSNVTSRDSINTSVDTKKSFLQLKGISVANYNMGCNFNIGTAVKLMMQYELYILAIQEHTAWNRELTEAEKKSFRKICDDWGYLIYFSKLQIIILDKQLLACIRQNAIHEDGRIFQLTLEITANQRVNFVSVYGYPHSPRNHSKQHLDTFDENDVLKKMRQLRCTLKPIITKALDANELIYVFGDLQDTPDNSRIFYYGPNSITRHPLGIVQTCENLGLECTIYSHMDSMPKPITSRHGAKGGRFIDGMFTTKHGLQFVTGITIISDTGISSDHDLIISKIDLGLKQFLLSDEKEERIDFRSILNIPMSCKGTTTHPELSKSVFKGLHFQQHAALYNRLQQVCKEPEYNIMPRIEHIKQQLEDYEKNIIERTRDTIDMEEQSHGKLIHRTPQDADFLNNISKHFFEVIFDVCRHADLARMVNILPRAAKKVMKKSVIEDKTIPGAAKLPITKHIDEAIKRSKNIHQRVQIILRTIVRIQKGPTHYEESDKCKKSLAKAIQIFIDQQPRFLNSIQKTISMCEEITTDRIAHIDAIEKARNRKIYDADKPYLTEVLEQRGRAEHEDYIKNVKRSVFGTENTQSTEMQSLLKVSTHLRLAHLIPPWIEIRDRIQLAKITPQSPQALKILYKEMRRAKKHIKNIFRTIAQVRQNEWQSAKIHYIRVGKYGNIANMINTKDRSGPTACKSFPTEPGDPIRLAVNDEERKEATILTHTAWMADPPGNQNCHFLDIVKDEIGPTGVTISTDKQFDATAQWNYLDCLLDNKYDMEIVDRIKHAHQRLPTLFKEIRTDKVLVYPFRYHCTTGEFMYHEVELNIRKNISKGNGKARATGFSISVLGRLPKIFTDAYILKCKIQMSLRLLDVGTENSLRICIGKPCGGVRPLTVGHDDNVFLNGLAQQAIQKEIARIQLLPDNLCSYQRGKGCADATIVDTVVKQTELQRNEYYLAKIDDDAEKMFDRLYIELQAALLLLAGAGFQGFTEWQCANIAQRTNKIVTDIFVSTIRYQCGLPQGNGFSVEVANLYALFILLWWNMDPVNPEGTITPFQSPRHGYPLIADGIIKSISSLAYVDDATRFVALPKTAYTLQQFFTDVQDYCNLLADLSLVIKMGRNVKKCTVFLYNIPCDAVIPQFSSIAWSYDAKGPVKGLIKTVTMKRNIDNNHLICYDVPKNMRNSAPQYIQDILTTTKYLGVPSNAQMDGTEGREIILKKLHLRIGLIASKTQNIAEAKIAHNMIVCQVATFSPICISFSLQECMEVDKQLTKAYQYRLKFMPSDAKHNIFISEKRGGLGIRSFTREYVGALLRDIEVMITNENTFPAHALHASIEAASQQCLWILNQKNILPRIPNLSDRVDRFLVSPKKIIHYETSFQEPAYEEVTFMHTHCMDLAIKTLSRLGFMLRDLRKEFCSRFVDELLNGDQFAKSVGHPSITNRSKMGACIGEGNTRFLKYSMTGRVNLILHEFYDEVTRSIPSLSPTEINDTLEEKLSRPTIYNTIPLFPREFSALKLASCARLAIDKLKEDYKYYGFYQLIEWRMLRSDIDREVQHQPRRNEYKVIINEDNCYRPNIQESMDVNSRNLANHLSRTLKLKTAQQEHRSQHDIEEDSHLSDNEILEYAMQHDMPIFLSVDGSFDKQRVATTTVSIIAPDIRHTDNPQCNEWQNRMAKILLIRSWRLPKRWGTGIVDINMAESLAFIIGEYTIPSDIPIIYITDSNNARTLQRNIKNLNDFTHRKKVRQVKQGIEYSIANHLEYLTNKWPRLDQLSIPMQRAYNKGVEMCTRWASQHDNTDVQHVQIQHFPRHSCSDSIRHPYDNDDMSSNGTSTSDEEEQKQHDNEANEKTRYHFDKSMMDILGRIIIIKVYSHQLNKDLSVKEPGKQPQPNLFIVSANQFADNAVSQAKTIMEDLPLNPNFDHIFYPPFSPRWCFTFEGSIINKGATKLLYTRLDDELCWRLQHREKQGLMCRLVEFNGIKNDYIGNESMNRNVVKQTAPSWTRWIYRHPSMAGLIWKRWYNRLTLDEQVNTSLTLPRGWQKIPNIANNVIKKCPFCTDSRDGDLEHLHLYCKMPTLQNARIHCHEKIENAIRNLYDFTTTIETGIQDNPISHRSNLQHQLEAVAIKVERKERLVIHQEHLILEARTNNIAIRSKQDITDAVLLHVLPMEKLQEYNRFPLAHRLGLIHSIPEDDFCMAKATITDVIYLGLIPKDLIHEMQSYARGIRTSQSDDDKKTFLKLIDQLIIAIIYRPATMQKVVQIILAKEKQDIEMECSGYMNNTNTQDLSETAGRSNRGIIPPNNNPRDDQISRTPPHTLPVRKACYATRCRLLRAKGILSRIMYCVPKKNMCSGCISESARQRKTAQLENDILLDVSPNSSLALVLMYRSNPISLRQFRMLMAYLPILRNKKNRDDHMFGAVRYIANTLGFKIENNEASEPTDPQIPDSEIKQMWRTATFQCKCPAIDEKIHRQHFGPRTFCTICTYPIFRPILTQHELCPVCAVNETWQQYNMPCIACRFAAIIYQHPFQTRFEKQVAFWTNAAMSDSSETDQLTDPQQYIRRAGYHNTALDSENWVQRRMQSIENNFKEMKARATPAQTKIVFQDLSLLQKNIRQAFLPTHSYNATMSKNRCNDNLGSTHTNAVNSYARAASHSHSHPTQCPNTQRGPIDGTSVHSESYYCWFSPMQVDQTVMEKTRIPRPPLSQLDMNSLASTHESTPDGKPKACKNNRWAQLPRRQIDTNHIASTHSVCRDNGINKISIHRATKQKRTELVKQRKKMKSHDEVTK